ncbi:hypothetical protein [Mycobacterium rhizamassiliense]|uniref:hypothetical protein n=1 Tax=Mycobacterium rhizamassiliense TaxID=1841860 RepID=UPI0012FF5E24|nr:hypothetical protein [Mycobacterium rhizamassiliense]
MLEGRLAEALAFNAPFVIDRLVKDRVADTPAFAELLFTEVKRYLVLCEATPDMTFGMCSSMVDEAWHAFILFTTEYTEYGRNYFGNYIHHSPADEHGAPEPTGASGQAQKAASFNDFRQRYEELYGHPLPAVWYDDSSIEPSRRVINTRAGLLTSNVDDHTIHLADEHGTTVLSVNELACEAVDFIAQARDFYVRELPGDLTEEEKIGIIAPLVRLGVLRLAP